MAYIEITLLAGMFLAIAGTLAESVTIYRQNNGTVSVALLYTIIKLIVFGFTAILAGLLSKLYFSEIQVELRQLSLLLMVIPVILFYSLKSGRFKDKGWWKYGLLDLPMLVLAIAFVSIVVNGLLGWD